MYEDEGREELRRGRDEEEGVEENVGEEIEIDGRLREANEEAGV